MQMVHEMTKMLMEIEPEQSHLHSSIGQLIVIDRGHSFIVFDHLVVVDMPNPSGYGGR